MQWKLIVFFSLFSFNVARADEKIITSEETTPQVVISGKQTDVEIGRDSIAGKIAIGRERISNSGLQNVGELLTREPSVTIGRDGRIGLLGLAGYTQILVDGVPPQRDISDMDLIDVERIEIIKSTTASTGPVGIAGTINIIRKRVGREVATQARVSSTTTAGKSSSDVSWSTNQVSSNSPLSYNLRISAFNAPIAKHTEYIQQTISSLSNAAEQFNGRSNSSVVTQSANVGGDINWKINSGHKLNFSPQFGYFVIKDRSEEKRWWMNGDELIAQQNSQDPMRIYDIPLRWDWNINSDSYASVYIKTNGSNQNVDVIRDENWPGTTDFQRDHREKSRNKNHFANFEFTTSTDSGHDINTGIKLTRNQSKFYYEDFLNGDTDYSLSLLSPEEFVRMNGAQIFLEDQWRINRLWSINGGISFERRQYKLAELDQGHTSYFNMFSPSFHVSRKIGATRKNQFRFSIARSFQPPEILDMLWRPNINPFSPCPAQQKCEENTIETADSVGNPALKPERALGINLSYSHALGKNSELSFELYSRTIREKIGQEFALIDVAWASTPRYVSRQANLGKANVRGISIEARVSGRDVSQRFSNLDIYGNLGFSESELSDVPGPDNRISGQSPWNFKIGGTYKAATSPFGFGIDISLLPADWVRKNVNQRVFETRKLTVGANSSWIIDKKSKIFINFNNIISPARTSINEYISPINQITRTTRSSNHSRISIRYEKDL